MCGARGEAYDRPFVERARAGLDVHGEARLVAGMGPRTVLDAGCGTGRVAIELAARGIDVVGVDIDEDMLETARTKAPHLEWIGADLATIDLRDDRGRRRRFDLVVAAGNVMIFLTPGTEAAVVSALAAHLAPGGSLVAGFQLAGLDLSRYDAHAAAAGLELTHRWAGWNREAWTGGGDYAVSVHRLPPGPLAHESMCR